MGSSKFQNPTPVPRWGLESQCIARVQVPEVQLAPDTCRASVAEGSVVTPAYLTGNDAETSALLAEAQPDLAADPVDYGVAPDGTIEIQIGETLGHYANWLQRPSDRIRTLNGLRNTAALIVGRRLKLDFSFLRLNADAIGLHEGGVPGHPASHGCIRVPRGTARRLFVSTRVGDPVTIVKGSPATAETAYFSSGDEPALDLSAKSRN
jgi:hypothetical protein